MDQLEKCKGDFLNKYNENRSVECGVRMAVNAAVQHNLLYSRNVQTLQRSVIRSYWGDCLDEIGGEFKKDVPIHTYEYIIEQLKAGMNRKFGNAFLSGSVHGSMFRVSHAQKSISVFIKHLWCLGEIPEPKICPIDRVVLKQTKARLSKDLAWGYVNTIEEHRVKFKYVLEAAAVEKLSVARWELFNFIA